MALDRRSASAQRFANHVLMIAPRDFRANVETSESNRLQAELDEAAAGELSRLAIEQHRNLRNLLIENGVTVTAARSSRDTPDAPFCNNWFSTHSGGEGQSALLVLYPMLAPNRRRERRPDLIEDLRQLYPTVLDLTAAEGDAIYLESTGSLCLDREHRTAYAAISPRTDLGLARSWAKQLDFDLVPFLSVDPAGYPYYHTNVMMFLGHGIAGICLESIVDGGPDLASRAQVEQRLRRDGIEILPLTQGQILQFCGNCMPLTNDDGDPLMVMSESGYRGFTAEERSRIERRATLLHTDLSAFESLGGGSARCLLAELF